MTVTFWVALVQLASKKNVSPRKIGNNNFKCIINLPV